MPDSIHAAVFDTPLGPCGLAWGPAGIVRAGLPEASVADAWTRLTRGLDEVVQVDLPADLQPLANAIRALMTGADADLSSAELDMAAVSDFEQSVYAICRAIPRGKALTYGDVAYRLGDVSLSRAVGVALGRNPFPPIVPCHRVLGADGKMVGFSATGGIALKRRLLALEGAIQEQPDLFG